MKIGVILNAFILTTITLFMPFTALGGPSCGAAAGAESPSKTSEPTPRRALIVLSTKETDDKGLPRNWRSANDPVKDAETLNLRGLSELRLSGSASFSEAQLSFLKKNKLLSNTTIVDLRQESHLWVNGRGITWYGKYNADNADKSFKEILNDEDVKASILSKQPTVTAYLPISRNDSLDPEKWEVKQVSLPATKITNEKTLVTDLGFDYFRITAPDHQPPRAEDVDRFIELTKGLGKNRWLHLHCAAGRGRTTTFMAMYDMIKNYDKATALEILARQTAMGGMDLTQTAKDSDPVRRKWKNARNAFVLKFYRYCQAEGPKQFKTSWTDWSQKN